MPRTLHDESRESSFAQWSAQMGAGIVQTVHLTAHLEQGIFPPAYLHAFHTFRRNVLLRSQPNSHGMGYSPRLEKDASMHGAGQASSRDRELDCWDYRRLAGDELPVHPDGSLTGVPVTGDLQRREPILAGAKPEILRGIGAFSGEFLQGPEFVLAGADLVEEVQQRSSHRELEEFDEVSKSSCVTHVQTCQVAAPIRWQDVDRGPIVLQEVQVEQQSAHPTVSVAE